MTQQELEEYLWGAATLLRGTIDAGDYKQYIFPLLFFKRICDVYDEEYSPGSVFVRRLSGQPLRSQRQFNHIFEIHKSNNIVDLSLHPSELNYATRQP